MIFSFVYDNELRTKKVKVAKGYELFADWIEDDIQFSLSSIELVESQIQNVKNGILSEIQSDGNSFVAFIKKDGVQLWNMYTDKKSASPVSLDEVLDLLHCWKQEISY